MIRIQGVAIVAERLRTTNRLVRPGARQLRTRATMTAKRLTLDENQSGAEIGCRKPIQGVERRASPSTGQIAPA